MYKTRIISAVAGTAIILSGVSSLPVFADNDDNGNRGKSNAASHLEKNVMRLVDMAESINNFSDRIESANIKPNGEFKLTGAKAVSVSGNSLTGSLYGLSLTVDVGSAKIGGGNTTIALSDIKAGDVLVVWGTLNKDTQAVTLSRIHDLTYANRGEIDRIQARINELLEMLRKLQEKLKGSF